MKRILLFIVFISVFLFGGVLGSILFFLLGVLYTMLLGFGGGIVGDFYILSRIGFVIGSILTLVVFIDDLKEKEANQR